MKFYANDTTKNFIREVKQLKNDGHIIRFNEVAARLGWDKTALSNVMNGRRDVPPDVYKQFTEVYKGKIKAEVDWRDEQVVFLKEQNAFLREQIQAKDAALQEVRNHLKELVSSEKLLAYLQSGLALANTTLDVLLAHRSVMEKKDLRKMKEEADTLHAEYQARLE